MGGPFNTLIPVCCAAILLAAPGPAHAHPSYSRFTIDASYGGNGKPGWVRAGDMDQDGDKDIVAGGGYALYLYENDGKDDGWQRYGSLDSTEQMGANGAVLHDVDGDGDLDVISAIYNGDLGWWVNPGSVLSNEPWAFCRLWDNPGSWYLHDFERFDLDGDGHAHEFVANLNSKYWNADIKILWFRIPDDPTMPWNVCTIEANRPEGAAHGHAGMDVADVNGDGNNDLAYSNGWYEAPPDPAGNWHWHPVTDFYGISNTLIRDMNKDDRPDLVVSAGHHGKGVRWYAQPTDSANGRWAKHVIDNRVIHPEGLAVLDLDGDDDLDVLAAELFFGEEPGEADWSEKAHNLYYYENLAESTVWQKVNISPNTYPNHLFRVIDVNEDGRPDLISESAGHGVVTYYRLECEAEDDR